MNDNLVEIISTESLSVDFFRGERKIAVFTDGDYKELKQISGEYGCNRYSLDDEITHTSASLIVGIGESEILTRAKEVAIKEGEKLILIPTTPTVTDFLPYNLTKTLSVENTFDGFTVLLVKDILNNRPRGKLALTLSSISAVLISLLDKAFECYLNEEDTIAHDTLELIKETLSKCENYGCPTPTLGFELAETLSTLTSRIPMDSVCSPLVTAYIFSLYKKENKSYNDYMFGTSFATFAVIDSYKVQPELFLPPKRHEVRAELKKIVPDFNEYVSLDPSNYLLRNFILKDRFPEISNAVRNFPLLAKSYLRLNGNSGFALRKRYRAEELWKFLPMTCEATKGMTLLKHIYSTGILK